jgi:hypothetical protein
VLRRPADAHVWSSSQTQWGGGSPSPPPAHKTWWPLGTVDSHVKAQPGASTPCQLGPASALGTCHLELRWVHTCQMATGGHSGQQFRPAMAPQAPLHPCPLRPESACAVSHQSQTRKPRSPGRACLSSDVHLCKFKVRHPLHTRLRGDAGSPPGAHSSSRAPMLGSLAQPCWTHEGPEASVLLGVATRPG